MRADSHWKTYGRKNFFLILPYMLVALVFIIVPITLIFVKSFMPTSAGSVAENWNFVNDFIWLKILKSFIVAILATIISVVIAYPFSYFLAFDVKGKTVKMLAVLFITAPTWMSFLVKIIGVKTFFDFINGFSNSTSGDVFTVIGLVYIYVPFMIMPIYNVLKDMPKNLIYASKDLGRGAWSTFINIVIPYTKNALISGLTLVFLPCLTSVSVPQFLNSSSSGTLIGDIIMEEGQLAQTSDISLARASTLALIVFLFLAAGVFIFWSSKKIVKYAMRRRARR
ncbi:MAG: ABC transporter permease [Mycoplasma sp.]|nr:ABC transporter permease [Mycoplasma sp.]